MAVTVKNTKKREELYLDAWRTVVNQEKELQTRLSDQKNTAQSIYMRAVEQGPSVSQLAADGPSRSSYFAQSKAHRDATSSSLTALRDCLPKESDGPVITRLAPLSLRQKDNGTNPTWSEQASAILSGVKEGMTLPGTREMIRHPIDTTVQLVASLTTHIAQGPFLSFQSLGDGSCPQLEPTKEERLAGTKALSQNVTELAFARAVSSCAPKVAKPVAQATRSAVSAVDTYSARLQQALQTSHLPERAFADIPGKTSSKTVWKVSCFEGSKAPVDVAKEIAKNENSVQLVRQYIDQIHNAAKEIVEKEQDSRMPSDNPNHIRQANIFVESKKIAIQELVSAIESATREEMRLEFLKAAYNEILTAEKYRNHSALLEVRSIVQDGLYTNIRRPQSLPHDASVVYDGSLRPRNRTGYSLSKMQAKGYFSVRSPSHEINAGWGGIDYNSCGKNSHCTDMYVLKLKPKPTSSDSVTLGPDTLQESYYFYETNLQEFCRIKAQGYIDVGAEGSIRLSTGLPFTSEKGNIFIGLTRSVEWTHKPLAIETGGTMQGHVMEPSILNHPHALQVHFDQPISMNGNTVGCVLLPEVYYESKMIASNFQKFACFPAKEAAEAVYERFIEEGTFVPTNWVSFKDIDYAKKVCASLENLLQG